MTDSGQVVRLDDPGVVAEQYSNTARLSARQGIWAFRRPELDFVGWALGQISLQGDEAVLDVGCGNGQYLRVLVNRGHAGRLVGVDISTGMLAAVPPRVSAIVADAQALPIVNATADVTLAMHMLYHVADKSLAVRELRRVTKPHGRLLVALSDQSSLSELHQLVDVCASQLSLPIASHDPGLGIDEAMTLLGGSFETVRRADVPGALHVTSAQPALEYVASISRVVRAPREQRDRLLALVNDRVAATIARHGSLKLTAGGSCLICQ